jgi:hypothetical protein
VGAPARESGGVKWPRQSNWAIPINTAPAWLAASAFRAGRRPARLPRASSSVTPDAGLIGIGRTKVRPERRTLKKPLCRSDSRSQFRRPRVQPAVPPNTHPVPPAADHAARRTEPRPTATTIAGATYRRPRASRMANSSLSPVRLTTAPDARWPSARQSRRVVGKAHSTAANALARNQLGCVKPATRGINPLIACRGIRHQHLK